MDRTEIPIVPLALVALVAAVLVGGLVVGVPGADPTNTTDNEAGSENTTNSSDSSENNTNLSQKDLKTMEVPEGIKKSGVKKPKTLAQNHADAVNDTGFSYSYTATREQDGKGSHNLSLTVFRDDAGERMYEMYRGTRTSSNGENTETKSERYIDTAADEFYLRHE